MKEDKKEHNCGSCVDACANPPVGEILLDIDLLRREHSTVLAACLSSCIFPSLFKYMSPKFFLFEVFFPFFFFLLTEKRCPSFSPRGAGVSLPPLYSVIYLHLLLELTRPGLLLFGGCLTTLKSPPHPSLMGAEMASEVMLMLFYTVTLLLQPLSQPALHRENVLAGLL